MVNLAEMSVAQRKALSKEELLYYLNRENQYDAYALNQEFKPVSDEILEINYNNIQAEPDEPADPDSEKRISLLIITDEVMRTANNERWSITRTIDELITKYV